MIPPTYGWICPKCGRVYAWSISACDFCNEEISEREEAIANTKVKVNNTLAKQIKKEREAYKKTKLGFKKSTKKNK